MLKQEKERIVAELTEQLRTAETLLVADYRGLTMKDMEGLREELLKHGARFQVVKNTLTRRAAELAGTEALLTLLDGPTAIAFLETEGDPAAVAKALSEAARTTRVLAIKGGILAGATITEADVDSLAKLPPADVLRGQVLGAIVAPLTAIASLLSAPLRDFVGLLDARVEQLREQGEGEGEEPAQAAEPVAEAEPVAGAAVEEVDETPVAGAPPAEAEAAEEPSAAEEPDVAEAAEEPEAASEPAGEGAPQEPAAEAPPPTEAAAETDETTAEPDATASGSDEDVQQTP